MLRTLTKLAVLGFATVSLIGCATASSTLVDPSKQYAPVENVLLLEKFPEDRPYEIIGYVEANPGSTNDTINGLLEVMRKEAGEIGAHAVVPVSREDKETPQNLIYNPYLGGYQVTGGHRLTSLRGAAIRFLD